MNQTDHCIKLKELVKLNIVKDENEDKFICGLCNKQLSYQRIIALKKCGHVMCKVIVD
jgi:hypothetical protein